MAASGEHHNKLSAIWGPGSRNGGRNGNSEYNFWIHVIDILQNELLVPQDAVNNANYNGSGIISRSEWRNTFRGTMVNDYTTALQYAASRLAALRVRGVDLPHDMLRHLRDLMVRRRADLRRYGGGDQGHRLVFGHWVLVVSVCAALVAAVILPAVAPELLEYAIDVSLEEVEVCEFPDPWSWFTNNKI